MSRIARLGAGVLSVALLVAIPTPSAGWVTPAAGGEAAAAKKKPCKKGKKRNRRGQCVKKKTGGQNTGVVPPYDAFGYQSGDGVVFVEVSANRRKVSLIRVRVPQENLTCAPGGSDPYAGALVSLTNLAINGKGEFAGADPVSDGEGPSEVEGKFLSQRRLKVTAAASQRKIGNGSDTCAGSITVTVKLKSSR